MESLHNINIPSSWNEITVDKFIQLKEIESSDFVSVLSYKMDQLFVLTDTNVDSEIWAEINTDQLNEICTKISWLTKQPTREFQKRIVIDSNEYVFKDLDTLTLGEFIDLEYLFSINYITELPKICAILYRKNKINDWGHIEIEPRKYNEKSRTELFYDIMITQVYGIIQAYLTFKKKFLDAFENMFLESDTEDKQENIPISIEEQEELKQDKLSAKWNWERLIYILGDNSSLNFDKVTELPLIFVFNQLSMRKDLKL